MMATNMIDSITESSNFTLITTALNTHILNIHKYTQRTDTNGHISLEDFKLKPTLFSDQSD